PGPATVALRVVVPEVMAAPPPEVRCDRADPTSRHRPARGLVDAGRRAGGRGAAAADARPGQAARAGRPRPRRPAARRSRPRRRLPPSGTGLPGRAAGRLLGPP